MTGDGSVALVDRGWPETGWVTTRGVTSVLAEEAAGRVAGVAQAGAAARTVAAVAARTGAAPAARAGGSGRRVLTGRLAGQRSPDGG